MIRYITTFVLLCSPLQAQDLKHGGRTFRLSEKKATWHEAHRLCFDDEARLARVDSLELHRAIRGYLIQKKAVRVWVDGSDALKEGSWVFADDTPIGDRVWADNQPDNRFDAEHAAALDSGVQFRFTDCVSGKRHQFIMEWPE